MRSSTSNSSLPTLRSKKQLKSQVESPFDHYAYSSSPPDHRRRRSISPSLIPVSVSESVFTRTATATADAMPTHTLFPPFHPDSWRAVDDRIRGGSSVSHLDPHGTDKNGAVRFWGTLDTKTLGGAGFASRCYTFDAGLRLPAGEYAGLAITLGEREDGEKHDGAGAGGEARRFTLVLKTSIPPLRPDGRRESTLSYEYTFTAPTTSRRITIPWSAFSPTYRGRPIGPRDPQYEPLDPGSVDRDGKERGGIWEMSLMCRSGFGRQEGEFSVVVERIEALAVGGVDAGDLEGQAWDAAGEREGRFLAFSWKTLALVAVACAGLTYVVMQWSRGL